MPDFKVAFCYYSCTEDVDGAERWHQRMLPRLKARGLNVMGINYRVTLGSCRLTTALEQQGVRVREVDAYGVPPTEGLQRLLVVLSEEQPTIVSPNHVTVAALSSIWCRQRGIRYLIMIRDDYDLFWTLADRFVWGDESCRAHGVVSVSRELQDRIDRRISTKVHTLCSPSSVPPSNKLASWSDDPFHVMYLGRMEKTQKRVDVLANQLVALSKKWPWLRGTFYGDGPDLSSLRDFLSSQPEHRISLGGVLRANDVYQALQSCQALVLLSTHEGLSTAMQEAMMNGVPVILKRMSSGFEDIVRDRENAWVLHADDELEQALEILHAEPTTWQRLSGGGRALAIERFAIDQAAERWFGFLQRLAHDATPQPFAPPLLSQVERIYADRIRQWGPVDDFERWLASSEDPTALMAMLFDKDVDIAQREWLLHLTLERDLLTDEVFTLRPDPDWSTDATMALMKYAVERGLDITPVVDELVAKRLPLQRRDFMLHQIQHHRRLPGEQIAKLAAMLVDEYQKILSRSPEQSYNLASMYELADKNEAAEALFEEIAEGNINHARRAGCLFHIGRLRLQRGARQGARAALTACLQRMPEHRRAAELLTQLDADGTLAVPNENMPSAPS